MKKLYPTPLVYFIGRVLGIDYRAVAVTSDGKRFLDYIRLTPKL